MNDADFKECNECLCFAARRVSRVVTQFYDAQMRGSGLRTTQFTLLAYLILVGSAPINAAADYLGVERTTLTRNLKPLLTLGYIRVESGVDRRVKLISITAAGREAAAGALPLWRKAQKAMSRRLGPAALQELAAAAAGS